MGDTASSALGRTAFTFLGAGSILKERMSLQNPTVCPDLWGRAVPSTPLGRGRDHKFKASVEHISKALFLD